MLASHEQRKYERLEPQGLAFVVFRPEFSKIGSIINISRGGLGFHYLCPAGNEDPTTETFRIIDIIASGNSFYLSKIPCTLVYDDKINSNRVTFMTDLVNRRCGLKFDPLTKKQEKQINLFLAEHTR
jgi:hypothetical protein